MNDVFATLRGLRQASHILRSSSSAQRNAFLSALETGLKEERDTLVAVNRRDLQAAETEGLSQALLDRLALTHGRLDDLIDNAQQVRALPDPVGAVTAVRLLENGLRVERRRTPLGVLCLICEARPNATVEAAALAVKSGNALALKGGSEAQHTNAALQNVLHKALAQAQLPVSAVAVLTGLNHEQTLAVLERSDLIDLVIPRGGPRLIDSVKKHARMPVLAHGPGVCHVYVDAEIELEQAVSVAVNAKANRPSTCNAAETLLVHGQAAEAFLPRFAKAYMPTGGELRGCPRTRALLSNKGFSVTAATEQDWATEYLANVLAVKVVDSLAEALEHIATYGTRHTDAILTTSLAAADRFTREVDASCVLVNASTRLNDGSCLGYGAELGISTSKFHWFGPMGLEALTIEKNVAVGDGQTRR